MKQNQVFSIPFMRKLKKSQNLLLACSLLFLGGAQLQAQQQRLGQKSRIKNWKKFALAVTSAITAGVIYKKYVKSEEQILNKCEQEIRSSEYVKRKFNHLWNSVRGGGGIKIDGDGENLDSKTRLHWWKKPQQQEVILPPKRFTIVSANPTHNGLQADIYMEFYIRPGYFTDTYQCDYKMYADLQNATQQPASTVNIEEE